MIHWCTRTYTFTCTLLRAFLVRLRLSLSLPFSHDKGVQSERDANAPQLISFFSPSCRVFYCGSFIVYVAGAHLCQAATSPSFSASVCSPAGFLFSCPFHSFPFLFPFLPWRYKASLSLVSLTVVVGMLTAFAPVNASSCFSSPLSPFLNVTAFFSFLSARLHTWC